MLSDHDRAALDLETRQWRHQGSKEAAIRALGTTAIRHYQRIARLIEDPEAIAYAPMTIARLRAVRDHQRGRSRVDEASVGVA